MKLAEQRCRNHEKREAACRCPECHRYFCRECVTEHDDRLLCATCLRQTIEGTTTHRGRNAGTAASVIVAALLGWLWFLVLADALIGFRPVIDLAQWVRR